MRSSFKFVFILSDPVAMGGIGTSFKVISCYTFSWVCSLSFKAMHGCSFFNVKSLLLFCFFKKIKQYLQDMYKKTLILKPFFMLGF